MNHFAAQPHFGQLAASAAKLKNYLLIGTDRSAFGFQFVPHAPGDPCTHELKQYFFNHTDPDGMSHGLATIGRELNRAVCLAISKPGGKRGSRNDMLPLKTTLCQEVLDFDAHITATTLAASNLDKDPAQNRSLGPVRVCNTAAGRTTESCPTNLLPVNVHRNHTTNSLSIASETKCLTKAENVKAYPGLQKALQLFDYANDTVTQNMVLLLFRVCFWFLSRYIQQMPTQSLGEELGLNHNLVHYGLTILGNHDSTDQYACIRQLPEGPYDFFARIIELRQDRQYSDLNVQDIVTCGNIQHGFYTGTRRALAEENPAFVTIAAIAISALTIGRLIELFQWAVGFCGTFINSNACHRPGVNAGKRQIRMLWKFSEEY